MVPRAQTATMNVVLVMVLTIAAAAISLHSMWRDRGRVYRSGAPRERDEQND